MASWIQCWFQLILHQLGEAKNKRRCCQTVPQSEELCSYADAHIFSHQHPVYKNLSRFLGLKTIDTVLPDLVKFALAPCCPYKLRAVKGSFDSHPGC